MRIITGIVIFSLLFFSCRKSNVEAQKITASANFSQETLNQIFNSWKKDSIACLGLRTQEKERIKHAIEQLELVGSNTDRFIQYLGKPNYIHVPEESREVYIYFLECQTKGKPNLGNLYLHIKDNQLIYYSTPVF